MMELDELGFIEFKLVLTTDMNGKIANGKSYNEMIGDIKQALTTKPKVYIDYYTKVKIDRYFELWNKLNHWKKLLQVDGANTKHQVLVDIERELVKFQELQNNYK